jgi:hypothetical protein
MSFVNASVCALLRCGPNCSMRFARSASRWIRAGILAFPSVNVGDRRLESVLASVAS